MSYDYKNLQNALTDYFGTAMASGNPAAMIDLIQVQQSTNEELLRTAQQNGFDLSRYTKNADYNPWK